MVVEGGSLSRSSVITWHNLLYHKSLVATQLWEREVSLHSLLGFRSLVWLILGESSVLLLDTSRDALLTTLDERLRRVTLATRGTGTSYKGSLPSLPPECTQLPVVE
ncbi:hypothetical protein E2C01_075692 [Portunus trituberculatus]|uniref:Uncharacterized protein n=1 Tax=Portunus trituberculatus TaxID=210409 RepID=A0A5B7IBB9_PORTR|nr:hypothetical protein [Portunus trituberculatus]